MKKGTFWIIAGLLLIAAALGLGVYNIRDSRRAENATREILTELVPLIKPDPVPMPAREAYTSVDRAITDLEENAEYPIYMLSPGMAMPVESAGGIGYVGVLSIPALELELSVIDRWDYYSLTLSPCVYSGTAYKGNFVICAHNYRRHFGQIKNLSFGDSVIFTDMSGNVFTYHVIEVESLRPADVDRMTSEEYDLTLFTCTVGGRSRIAVRCEKIRE